MVKFNGQTTQSWCLSRRKDGSLYNEYPVHSTSLVTYGTRKDFFISTKTNRHRDDTTYDLFYEIEAYCKSHHFTVFYGPFEDEGLPQAAWNREEDPRWEHFLDIAKSLAVQVIYLDRHTLTKESLFGGTGWMVEAAPWVGQCDVCCGCSPIDQKLRRLAEAVLTFKYQPPYCQQNMLVAPVESLGIEHTGEVPRGMV